MQPDISIHSESLATEFGEVLIRLDVFEERKETRYSHSHASNIKQNVSETMSVVQSGVESE